jgi:polysaccharide deacetylase 2 family uncharacterized protein YibQ
VGSTLSEPAGKPAAFAWRGRLKDGWQWLAVSWAAVLSVMLVGGIVLAILGAPPARQAGGPVAPANHDQQAETGRPGSLATQPTPAAAPAPAPGVADPALLEPGPDGGKLPRRAADGRGPMQVYAAAAPPIDGRPRVALLLAGIGQDVAASQRAITQLPGAVSLAISPYAVNGQALVTAARAQGHELLLSMPLEPTGFPLNDAGPHALLTGAADERNTENLRWALGRITQYAGVTGALDGLRGERFAAVPAMLAPVLLELASRGLFYVDPRPRQGGGAAVDSDATQTEALPAGVAGMAVDLVLDEVPDNAAINAKLDQLARLARDHGSALGLAGPPRPVVLERLVSWSKALESNGVVLVPVSALVPAPREADSRHR